ncbi:GIY-YIG nuclease family protein [Geodermatophilus sp. DSM 45219]|uniref:GIY-YIG nuclease family protein n=1 Tax=Geodermatophilus sp. DSM 45219 TaxID=1881103 RepID=UPI000884A1EB|nr:GIY-YIG nuclease family protein [Geodermatophilus sp. DSM 45219]SDN78563.1 GIY-YIG catalytic domain-containing protein [Geodermatophilus sp. DSM 45219]
MEATENIEHLSGAELPEYTVYLYRNQADRVIYVGTSRHLKQRLDQHRWLKPWWREELTLETETVRGRATALYRGMGLIKQHRPIYNRSHNNDDPMPTFEEFFERAITETHYFGKLRKRPISSIAHGI